MAKQEHRPQILQMLLTHCKCGHKIMFFISYMRMFYKIRYSRGPNSNGSLRIWGSLCACACQSQLVWTWTLSRPVDQLRVELRQEVSNCADTPRPGYNSVPGKGSYESRSQVLLNVFLENWVTYHNTVVTVLTGDAV